MNVAAAPIVVSPCTLEEAFALLRDDPPPRPLAGGTDVMVELALANDAAARQHAVPAAFLDLSHLTELRGIRTGRDGLSIGALTTFTDLRRSPAVQEHVPILAEVAAQIGGPQIRNRGTVAGNLATASPAADMAPPLLALDAVVVVGGPRGERSVPLDSFFLGYRHTALAPDELIIRIDVPFPAGREVRFRKVARRRAQAISVVAIALGWRETWSTDGRRAWTDVRIALGAVAPTPVRARAAEAVLEAAWPTSTIIRRAADALAADIDPIDDVRAGAAYRRHVAGAVLAGMLEEAAGRETSGA